MDCYRIAKNIMVRMRMRKDYQSVSHIKVDNLVYYDDSKYSEYFTLKCNGAAVLVSKGRIYEVEITNPKGLIHFNLLLWLLEIDRMTSKLCSTNT